MPKILIILTGGTIEKTYSETEEKNIFSEESNSIIQKIVEKNIRVQDLEIEYVRALQKDSLDMNDEDRNNILNICTQTSAEKIIITHGTSTMTKTAELLQTLPEISEKTIVFTGAMRPYSLYGDSADAVANVASSLTAVQILEKGMFVTMNGKVFPVGKVQKNEEEGMFEEK